MIRRDDPLPDADIHRNVLEVAAGVPTHGNQLVRQFRRDVSSDNTSGGIYDPRAPINLETAVEWDLKNTSGIPIASGLYLIHVEVPNVGERTIKFFGVLRPIDLDTF